MTMEAKFHALFLFSLLLPLYSSPPLTNAHRISTVDSSLLGTLKGNSTLGISKLKNFLSSLGYLEPQSSPSTHDNLFDESLEQAIRKYQSFFKLPPTGTLDSATLASMRRPRCGVADLLPHNTSAHYTFFPNNLKWPKKSLTYSFAPGTRNEAYAAIRHATDMWAGASDFKFKYTKDYDRADIKISFQVRDHGDGSVFDGSRGVLAHAFAPTDGRLHFDGDERWVDGVVGGAFDLQTVGLHELGHVLGLGHSADGGSIMWPQIGDGFRKGLGKDDIDGIKALYSS